MSSLKKVGAFILIFAGIIASLDFLIGFLTSKDPDFLLHHGICQVTFYVLFVLLVFLFQKYVNREGFLQLVLKPYPGWISLLLRGWTVGVMAFVSYSILMGAFGVVEFKYRPGFERMLVAFFVAFSGFAIALTEEILFRGFFLQTMLKDLPKWMAVTLTGLIFVVFHDLAHPFSFFTETRQMMLAV